MGTHSSARRRHPAEGTPPTGRGDRERTAQLREEPRLHPGLETYVDRDSVRLHSALTEGLPQAR